MYNGVSTLWDRETGTIWDHITGEALYGPLVGKRLPGMFNLLHMTAEQAVGAYPDIAVAISDRPMRRASILERLARVTQLSARFTRSLSREDDRRPRMDIGLGIMGDALQRFYPLESITAGGGAIVDNFGGRRVVIYRDPTSGALSAFYTTARSATWRDRTLMLDDGHVFAEGVLTRADGRRVDVERPLQLFTRWYGFALTFPDTEVFAHR